MSGINRIINGKVAQSKSKGKKFVEELNKAFAPEAIAKEKGEKVNKKK